MSCRQMSVNGTFYPSNCEEIEDFIKRFNSIKLKPVTPLNDIKAIISPHAGYIYSGFSANCVFKLLDKKLFKRVVVLGPSHRVALKGASIAYYNYFDTPCGDLEIDLNFSKMLKQKYNFLQFNPEVHHEHSTEVQMPFVKHYLNNLKVVEIIYGAIDYQELVPMIEELLIDKDTLLIVSTDLSHFYKLNDAKSIDKICIEGIINLDVSKLDQGCEACGKIGVKALLLAAKNCSLKSQIIDYRTSYDASGDDSSVVGYLSTLIG